ncbi:MAG: 5-(carboxyamino)imidazole ribonucleotide synthase [Planctomycetota bacterium]
MVSPDTPIQPPATLGMLGGGQLGLMFIHAAHRRGYRVHVFCPDPHCPAGRAADTHTAKPYDDLDAVAAFAQDVAAVTYEFENVPADTAAACAAHAPVRPGQHVLHIAQDRLREKQAVQQFGVPVGPFAPVHSEDELRQALDALGTPAVLKTAHGGYDGKGQRVLHSPADAPYAWHDLGQRPCILEAFVDFEQELSVIAARSVGGTIETFGPVANTHRNHILDVSVVPCGAPPHVEQQAREAATAIMQGLDVVGVLCVEFFQTRPGYEQSGTHPAVLVNELAPRPHNSGHLTIEACAHSQFDQQVLTVTGHAPQPFNTPDHPLKPTAMANLLGDLYPPPPAPPGTTPDFTLLAEYPDATAHDYDKGEPRPGRKMGHLTAQARTAHEAIRDAVEARARLAPPAQPPIAPE